MSDSNEKKRARVSGEKEDRWLVFPMLVAELDMIDSIVLQPLTRSRKQVDVLIEGTLYTAVEELRPSRAHELLLAFADAKRTGPAKLSTLLNLLCRETLVSEPLSDTETETEIEIA